MPRKERKCLGVTQGRSSSMAADIQDQPDASTLVAEYMVTTSPDAFFVISAPTLTAVFL